MNLPVPDFPTWWAEQLRRADQATDEALEQLDALRAPPCRVPSPQRLAVDTLIVELLTRLSRFAEIEALLPALAAALPAAEPLQRARFLALRASQHVRMSRLDAAVADLVALADTLRAAPEPRLQLWHALALGQLLMGQHQPLRALERLRDALALAEPLDARYAQLLAWLRLAHAHLALGQRPAQQAALDQLVARAQQWSSRHAECNARIERAMLAIDTGRAAAAEADLVQAAALIPTLPGWQQRYEKELRCARAYQAAAAERWDEAAALMLTVVELDRRIGARQQLLRRLHRLVDWQRRAGQPEAALGAQAEVNTLELVIAREAQAQALQARIEGLERDQARQEQERLQRHADELQRANLALAEALGAQQDLQEELLAGSRQAALTALFSGLARELHTPLGNARVALDSLRATAVQTRHSLQQGQLGRSGLQAALVQVDEGGALAQRSLDRVLELLGRLEEIDPGAAPPLELRRRLAEVAERAWRRSRAAERGLLLHLQGGELETVRARTLEELLALLFENCALHAYPDPQDRLVSVQAECTDGRWRLRVADQGCGIAPERLPHLFDPYGGAAGSGGGGLGLFRAQALVVARLKGRIRVHSQPGQGTECEIEWHPLEGA